MSKGKDKLEDVYKASDYADVYEAYKDPATEYARQVLSGEVLAGYKMRLAMFRHIRDLKRVLEGDKYFPFHYDLKEVKYILAFAQLVPDVDRGEPLPLTLSQQMILSMTVGWRRQDGSKRFYKAIVSMARTNGKTYLLNILMMYVYLVESQGHYNVKLLLSAPVSTQLATGWNYLMLTANRLASLPEFKKQFIEEKIDVQETQIRSRKTRNLIEKQSAQAGNFDSSHYLFAVLDEAGSDNIPPEVIAKISSGQVQIPNHQFFQISTAYTNPDVGFRRTELDMTETIEKDWLREKEDTLLLVWEQDDISELDKPETWIKSNPILAITDKYDSMISSMMSERDTAISNGRESDFISRNLNTWIQDVSLSFLSVDDIEGAIIDAPPFDITGREVYIGWDYSVKADTTAFIFAFPYLVGEEEHAYIHHFSFVPTAVTNGDIYMKEKQDKLPYRKAEKEGHALISNLPSGDIDDDVVYDWLLSFIDEHQLDVKYFIYDQYRVTKLIKMLEQNTDIDLIPLKQNFMTLTEPTKALRKAFNQGRIHYVQDDVLQGALYHATLSEDNNSIMVDKKKRTLKIDAVDALVNVYSELPYHWEAFSGHKEAESKSIFGNQSNDQINTWFKDSFSF